VLQYAGYCLFGLLSAILGAVYYSEVGSEFVAGSLAAAGLCMLVLGGVALFGIHKNSWLILLVVECCNGALLLLIIIGTILGFVLGSGSGDDPIQLAMEKSFAEPTFAMSTWDGEYCMRQEGALCKDDFMVKATSALNNRAFASFDRSATVGSIFGNCTMAGEEAAANDAAALEASCVRCKNKCRHWMVLDLKQYLKPATAVVFCVLIFVILTIIMNDMLISDLNRWVFQPLLGYVMCDEFGEASLLRCNVYGLNGLTAAAGIAMTVASYLGDEKLAEGCPPGGDCSNSVVTVVGVVGVGLFLLGVATLVSLNLPMQTVGKLVIRGINVGYAALGFLLLVCGVFVSIISGGVESMQAATDDNFPELRRQYETQDPDYCVKDRRPMTDDDCRQKILADIESMVLTLAIVAFVLAVGMVAVMYVTLRAIKMMKGTTLLEKVIDDVIPDVIVDADAEKDGGDD
jgi:hypothetical protein